MFVHVWVGFIPPGGAVRKDDLKDRALVDFTAYQDHVSPLATGSSSRTEQPQATTWFDEAVAPRSQSTPDFIGAVWKRGDFGHVRATGIYRDLRYKSDAVDDRVAGYGGTVSGLIKTHREYGNPIQFQLVAGRGIATYLVSFDGLNYDAAPDGNGELKSIPTVGGWASYELFFNKQWHMNFVGGFDHFYSHPIAEFTIPGSDGPLSSMTVASECGGWGDLQLIFADGFESGGVSVW